ncbi:3971_t:CDS:2, partial [Rhizophagus irregularis]
MKNRVVSFLSRSKALESLAGTWNFLDVSGSLISLKYSNSTAGALEHLDACESIVILEFGEFIIQNILRPILHYLWTWILTALLLFKRGNL